MPIFTCANGDGADDFVPLRENQATLAKKYGIEHFEFPFPSSGVKSVGFNPKTQTWYGWSHRAIAGFKVGDVVKKGDVIAAGAMLGPPLRNQRIFEPGFRAKSLQDARDMAASFAEWVA